MGLVRASPLKDFRVTALSTTDVSTGYALGGGLTTGEKLYAALHLTAVSTSRVLVMTIQSATASAFAAPTTRFTFSLTSEVGSTWGTPVANLSTEHKWWRANWTLSTVGLTTGGTWKGLVWAGMR